MSRCGRRYSRLSVQNLSGFEDLYRDLLPAINSRLVDLVDDARLLAQIVGLERRTARGGRDIIDHAPGAHDDVANAVAGVVDVLTASKSGYDRSMRWVSGPHDDDDGPPMIRTPRGTGRIDSRH
jgi:hypothetical protein